MQCSLQPGATLSDRAKWLSSARDRSSLSDTLVIRSSSQQVWQEAKSETAADRTSSCTSDLQVAVTVLWQLAAAGVAPGPSQTSNAHKLSAMMHSLK